MKKIFLVIILTIGNATLPNCSQKIVREILNYARQSLRTERILNYAKTYADSLSGIQATDHLIKHYERNLNTNEINIIRELVNKLPNNTRNSNSINKIIKAENRS